MPRNRDMAIKSMCAKLLIKSLSLHRHPKGSAKAEGELLAQTKGAATKDWAVQTHARYTDTLPNSQLLIKYHHHFFVD